MVEAKTERLTATVFIVVGLLFSALCQFAPEAAFSSQTYNLWVLLTAPELMLVGLETVLPQQLATDIASLFGIGLAIVGAFWAVFPPQKPSPDHHPESEQIASLRRQYARDEITEEELERGIEQALQTEQPQETDIDEETGMSEERQLNHN